MSRRSLINRLGLVLLTVGFCLVTYFGAPYFRSTAINVLDWIDGLGYWAPVAFVVISAVGVLLVLPGFLFSLGAGFMFGFLKGVALLWLSINIGAVMAFLLGRRAGSERFVTLLEKHKRLEQMNDVLLQKGWRVVMCTRVIPMFPFKLSNYAFGMAGYSLKDFWFGTTIGIIPLCMFNVYIGSLAGALSELGSRERPLSTVEWAMYALGVCVLGFFLLYIGVKARDALRTTPKPVDADSGDPD